MTRCFDDTKVQLALGHEFKDKTCESDKIILTKGDTTEYYILGVIVIIIVEFC